MLRLLAAVMLLTSSTATVDVATMTALKAFYLSTGGPTWGTNTYWLDGDPCAAGWSGVTCNTAETDVVQLSLKDRNMAGGTLPSEFGMLSALTFVEFKSSSIEGTIPSELGQQTLLTYIDFKSNAFTGRLPSWLGRLTDLATFDLMNNGDLCGTIPAEITYSFTTKQLKNTAIGSACGVPTPSPSSGSTTYPSLVPKLDPTVQPSSLPTPIPTLVPTLSPTVQPSLVPTPIPTLTPTPSPTVQPSLVPTPIPTLAPTLSPTVQPSLLPTTVPTPMPSLDPTVQPSFLPTPAPTLVPTQPPTAPPTSAPSSLPTTLPTPVPTQSPTVQPSSLPTTLPTPVPTMDPTLQPSLLPIPIPTLAPTLSPTLQPSLLPTPIPTPVPTLSPTVQPSLVPTSAPTPVPTLSPTVQPSSLPTPAPTPVPTLSPTVQPSSLPSPAPTPVPTLSPTAPPSSAPSLLPTTLPTPAPTSTFAPTTKTPKPTTLPSPVPSYLPTLPPSPLPSASPSPSPSTLPSPLPTLLPSLVPSPVPSYLPTLPPNPLPSAPPSPSPSALPSPLPTLLPSLVPSPVPSYLPTLPPSPLPSAPPSPSPSALPASVPTLQPSLSPTLACDPGTFLDVPTHTCLPCAVGRSSLQLAPPFETNCSKCDAGKYTNAPGSSPCEDCPTGKLSNADHTLCEDCQAGEYNRLNLECAACESGRYAPQPQTGQCLACRAGSHTNNASRATTCAPCDSGKYSHALSVECAPCPAGFASVSGQAACVGCEAGRFASSIGSSVCSECAAGFASADPGASACLACPVATFRSNTGGRACQPCPAGAVAASTGSLSCSFCPRGYSAPAGSFSCTGDAASNYFILGGVARECPKNAKCTGGTAMPKPVKGHWVRRSTKYADEIFKCPSLRCSPEGEDVDESSSNTNALPITRRQRQLLSSTGGDEQSALVASASSSSSSSSSTSLCWGLSAYGDEDDDNEGSSSACHDDDLMCMPGARGPLCGSCDAAFVYSSVERVCLACDLTQNGLLPAVVGVLVLGAALYVMGRVCKPPPWLESSWLWGFPQHVDSGALRVMWSNYQIVQSVSWSLDVHFPSPFKEMMSMLSMFSFDFLSLECLFEESNHFTSVYLWSAAPIVLALLLAIAHLAAYVCQTHVLSRTIIASGLIHRLLVLGYLVLPSVALKQLQALDCVEVAGGSYLRIDTSIDCNSSEFATFRIVDGFFILLYLSLPLLWLTVLCPLRERLNPPLGKESAFNNDVLATVLSTREGDNTLKSFRFLFASYLPPFYYLEVPEMYRRVLFIGVLPLLTAKSLRRAALGMFFSLCSLAFYRETEPFISQSTNILAYVAQYGTLLTYGAALAIEVGLDDGVNDLLMGTALVCCNGAIVLMILRTSTRRFLREEAKKKWRHQLTAGELKIVYEVMDGTPEKEGHADAEQGIELVVVASSRTAEGGATADKDSEPARSERALKQLLLNADDVKMEKRVGAGAFGEVFKGSLIGQPVAVKTILNVTSDNIKAFRAEILMTATLRHPNVVSFMGACWGESLLCLVLEWVPRGSLADTLESKVANAHNSLRWDDPLLRLATDVARGMAYLHKREYFDERDGQLKRCILHRDLKPDNVLVSEFTAAKITDFGTSRAKAADDVTMTAVGTPLFCAPEISRGESYGEAIDTYSFGLILVDMATGEDIMEFIAKRWMAAFNKKHKPSNVMRLLRPMIEDEWRPVTTEDPIPFAPTSINALIVRCCSPDPKMRPSFDEILEELSGPCAEECTSGKFTRNPLNETMAEVIPKDQGSGADSTEELHTVEQGTSNSEERSSQEIEKAVEQRQRLSVALTHNPMVATIQTRADGKVGTSKHLEQLFGEAPRSSSTQFSREQIGETVRDSKENGCISKLATDEKGAEDRSVQPDFDNGEYNEYDADVGCRGGSYGELWRLTDGPVKSHR